LIVGVCAQLPDSPGPERILSLTADDYDTACEVIGRGSNFFNYFRRNVFVIGLKKDYR
jgi:hypothetical protein